MSKLCGNHEHNLWMVCRTLCWTSLKQWFMIGGAAIVHVPLWAEPLPPLQRNSAKQASRNNVHLQSIAVKMLSNTLHKHIETVMFTTSAHNAYEVQKSGGIASGQMG
jgi:hypothetical protein